MSRIILSLCVTMNPIPTQTTAAFFRCDGDFSRSRSGLNIVGGLVLAQRWFTDRSPSQSSYGNQSIRGHVEVIEAVKIW